MHQVKAQPTTSASDARGWTRERRVQFLTCLARKGDVRRACREVGLSRQSAYKLRLRDADFSQMWAKAMMVARERRKARRMIAMALARAESRFAALAEPRAAVDTWGERKVTDAPALNGKKNDRFNALWPG